MSLESPCKPSHFVIRSNLGGFSCEGSGCFVGGHKVAARLSQTVSSVYDFFLDRFGLCGIDGKGNLPEFEIDWNEKNAAWTCSSSTNTCKWKFHNQYAIKPDVVAHEYTHGILHGRLRYLNESGAINESSADIFAVAFKHWLTGSTQDWSIDSLRDLSLCLGQNFLKQGSYDHGYVHDNSQIPSHAFYWAVMQTDRLAYGRIADIWFETLKRVDFDETFYGFAIKTIAQAVSSCSKTTVRAVTQSWVHVGVISISPSNSLREKTTRS